MSQQDTITNTGDSQQERQTDEWHPLRLMGKFVVSREVTLTPEQHEAWADGGMTDDAVEELLWSDESVQTECEWVGTDMWHAS